MIEQDPTKPPTQDMDSLIAARRKALSAPAGGLDSLIASRRQALAQPEKPGVLSRAADMIGGAVSHAVEHPIDTIESAVVAPIKSAFTAAVAPGVGESRPDARLSKGGNSSGRAIDTSPYDAAHGGVTTKERTAAGIQSVVNAAAPAAFGPLAGKVGKTATLAVTGAAEGAAYNPDDPAAGAIAGGVMAPAVGTAVRGTTKAVDATRDVVGKARRIRSAAPLDQTAIADTKATKVADQENYGRSRSEAEANGGTSPAVQNALADPKIKDYVDEVRGDLGPSASDAETLAEVRVRVSADRRGYQKAAAAASVNGKYDPKMARTIKTLKGSLQRLDAAMAATSTKPAITLDVAPEVFESAPKVQPGREPMAGPTGSGPLSGRTTPPNPTLSQGLRNFSGDTPNAVQGPDGPAFQLRGQPEKVTPGVRVETPAMRVQTAPAEEVAPLAPSHPIAVSEHARMKGNRAAFNTAADATKRIMRGTSVAANKLDTQSPAAFLEEILGMNPEEAQHALQGTLGRAKDEATIPAPGPGSTLWGTVTSPLKPAVRVRRIAPFIDAIDKQAGNPVFSPTDLTEALKYLGVATAPNPDRRP